MTNSKCFSEKNNTSDIYFEKTITSMDVSKEHTNVISQAAKAIFVLTTDLLEYSDRYLVIPAPDENVENAKMKLMKLCVCP